MTQDLAERAFAAVGAGDLEELRAIVAADPAVTSARDRGGLSLVLQAAYRGRRDMVELLVRQGVSLDIFEASAVDDTERVRDLAVADPERVNAWSADGFTPLHLAAFFGHVSVVRLLLEEKADVTAVSRNRMEVMPLHNAVAARHAPIAEALLDGGAPVDARAHGGYTPLLEAVQNGDRDLVELLLARGADPTLTRDDGRTPRDLALEKGHEDVADVLQGWGD